MAPVACAASAMRPKSTGTGGCPAIAGSLARR